MWTGKEFGKEIHSKRMVIINLKIMKNQRFETYNLLHGQFKTINREDFVLNEVNILKACMT
jgi:hypothetical protein